MQLIFHLKKYRIQTVGPRHNARGILAVSAHAWTPKQAYQLSGGGTPARAAD